MSTNFYPYVQGWRVGNAPSSNDQPSVFGAFSRTSGNATAARDRQRYLIVTDAPQHPQRTVYYDNHRRTVALIDDRRTAQRGDARACCRGGPCEAGCTLGQTVRTILSLGNIDASVSGTYSPLHNRLDLGLWGSGAFGTSVFPMGNIYAYVLRCPS